LAEFDHASCCKIANSGAEHRGLILADVFRAKQIGRTDINKNDHTWYLSVMLVGLSIQELNGFTQTVIDRGRSAMTTRGGDQKDECKIAESRRLSSSISLR
jgi:hypothetical protein